MKTRPYEEGIKTFDFDFHVISPDPLKTRPYEEGIKTFDFIVKVISEFALKTRPYEEGIKTTVVSLAWLYQLFEDQTL